MFAIAVLAGFAFGAADQYLGSLWSLVNLGPWATSLSGMSATWLVLPFAFGLTQDRPRRAAALGLTATLAALSGYFVLTLSPIEGVSLHHVNLVAFVRSQQLNIAGGVVTGPLFGFLGHHWRTRRSWVSAALVAGAVCLEPLVRYAVGRLEPTYWVWALESLCGLTLATYFVRVRAGEREPGSPGR